MKSTWDSINTCSCGKREGVGSHTRVTYQTGQRHATGKSSAKSIVPNYVIFADDAEINLNPIYERALKHKSVPYYESGSIP